MDTARTTTEKSGYQGHVAVVDDDPSLTAIVEVWLRHAGFEVSVYADGESCLAGLKETLPDAICLDLNMPGMSGLETLERVKARHRNVPVLILTAETAIDTVVAAMQLGAYDYLTKPLDQGKLVTSMRNAVERHHLAVRLTTLEREASNPEYPGIIGRSPAMRALFREIDRVSASDVTVLITGASGTGKELVAKALHEESSRSDGPFVAVNCAAIPESLIESELFGHEKGSFTGAVSRHIGRFEQADGGTLFLDEIAELSLPLQAKMLRAIQERRFHRVGGTTEIKSDFRLLAATHRDLADRAENGLFREDLFYRLAVFEIEVPSLKERTGDIRRLAEHFLTEFSENGHVEPTAATWALIESYSWPGNVRELENAMRRAAVLAQDGTVTPHYLPPRVRKSCEAASTKRAEADRVAVSTDMRIASATPSLDGEHSTAFESSRVAGNGRAPLPQVTLAELERRAIVQALHTNNGNVSAVGRQLGIGRTSLYRKLAKYGLR